MVTLHEGISRIHQVNFLVILLIVIISKASYDAVDKVILRFQYVQN